MRTTRKKAMAIRECYAAGYEMGWNSATWVDLPEIGQQIDRFLDCFGNEEINADNQLDIWFSLCQESVENAKCYSPFEFTASAINKRDEVYGEMESELGWLAFERGMYNAISRQRRKRFPLNNKRKWR